MVDERFLDKIDAAYPKLGFSDRSAFIRDAVYKLMKEGGYEVPLEYKAAPSRKGKGGRRAQPNIQAVPGVGKVSAAKAG